MTVDEFATRLMADGIEYPFSTIEQQRDIYRSQRDEAVTRATQLQHEAFLLADALRFATQTPEKLAEAMSFARAARDGFRGYP